MQYNKALITKKHSAEELDVLKARTAKRLKTQHSPEMAERPARSKEKCKTGP